MLQVAGKVKGESNATCYTFCYVQVVKASKPFKKQDAYIYYEVYDIDI